MAITLAELAARSGSSVERAARLVAIGIVPDRGEGAFEPSDVNRVRMAEAMDAAGTGFDVLARAVAGGFLSFDFLDGALPAPPELADATYRQEAARLGVPVETLLSLFEAWGLPRPDADARARTDEVAAFEEFARFMDLGAIVEETLRRGASVSGESARRLANWAMDFFRTFVDEPIRRAGGTPQQVLDAAAAITSGRGDSLERQFTWLLRRTVEHHALQYIVELVEEAIEDAGLPVARLAGPPAIAFLDMTGYTALTEELGDEAAADRALSLARVVQEPVGRYGGRVVKLLGDGAMLHFPEPAAAVRCALELVDRVPRESLPSARLGISAGSVVWRDGDAYGRTVNVAARLLGVADPGEVVVTHPVVEASGGGGLVFEPLGPVELKGVSEPADVFRATGT